MEHKVHKLGIALAAGLLGLSVPALASAEANQNILPDPSVQTDAQDAQLDVAAPEAATVSEAIASMDSQTQRLADLGSLGAGDIVLVSLADIGASADQRYSMLQSIDPSRMAALQQTLGTVMVTETPALGGDTNTVADHLRLVGVDPASVVAVNVDDSGLVTLYHQ